MQLIMDRVAITTTPVNPITQFKSILALCSSNTFVDEFVKLYIPLHKNVKSAFIEFSKVHKNYLTPSVLDAILAIINNVSQSTDLLDFIVQIYEKDGSKVTTKSTERPETPKSTIVVTSGYPKVSDITTFKDVVSKIGSIVTTDVKSKDCFYNISTQIYQSDLTLNYKRDHKIKACREQADKTYISGSYALKKFISIFTNEFNMNRKDNMLNLTTWKDTDIDVFMLNCPKDFHYKIDQVDIIMSEKTNVEQLLLSFDLPINRVAIDKDDNFIISAECLRAIYTKKYYLHERLNPILNVKETTYYIKGLPGIKDAIKKSAEGLGGNTKSGYKSMAVTHKLNKIHRRIEKYAKRGFKPEYVSWKNEHVIFTPECYERASNY